MKSAIFASKVVSNDAGHGRRHLFLLVTLLVLIAFAFADAGIVAWYAHKMSGLEIVTAAFAFVLVSLGAIVTIWELDR